MFSLLPCHQIWRVRPVVKRIFAPAYLQSVCVYASVSMKDGHCQVRLGQTCAPPPSPMFPMFAPVSVYSQVYLCVCVSVYVSSCLCLCVCMSASMKASQVRLGHTGFCGPGLQKGVRCRLANSYIGRGGVPGILQTINTLYHLFRFLFYFLISLYFFFSKNVMFGCQAVATISS